MENELYSINDYGYIEIDIKSHMNKQKISRNELARKIGTRFEVVNKWYSGHVNRIDADVLARICYVLNCSPSDIVIYQKKTDADTK